MDNDYEYSLPLATTCGDTTHGDGGRDLTCDLDAWHIGVHQHNFPGGVTQWLDDHTVAAMARFFQDKNGY